MTERPKYIYGHPLFRCLRDHPPILCSLDPFVGPLPAGDGHEVASDIHSDNIMPELNVIHVTNVMKVPPPRWHHEGPYLPSLPPQCLSPFQKSSVYRELSELNPRDVRGVCHTDLTMHYQLLGRTASVGTMPTYMYTVHSKAMPLSQDYM